VVLSLNNNKLTLLPPGLWRLKNLRSLNIAGTTKPGTFPDKLRNDRVTANAFVANMFVGNPDLLTRIPDDIMKAGTKEILKFLHQTESGKSGPHEKLVARTRRRSV
jgi:hypothetical protein